MQIKDRDEKLHPEFLKHQNRLYLLSNLDFYNFFE